MPHIRLEHSADIKTKKIPVLFDDLINILIKYTNVKSENCKCKIIKVNEYYLKSNKLKEGFIHLDIKILEGRSKDIINQIGEKSIKVLQLFFQAYTKDTPLQYSIEIQEMKYSNYFTSNKI